jgi:BlaI family penicillinase repressor
MKELTKAEEQIMHVLWELGKAFVKDIILSLPDPKPAYNTVSTIVRIMEKKGFVDHKAYGKTFEYYPVVTKEEYTQLFMRNFVRKYFGDSYPEMVSFFAQDRKLTLGELEEIKTMITREISKQKRKDHG